MLYLQTGNMGYCFYALFIFSFFVGSLDGADGIEWKECKTAMDDGHFSEREESFEFEGFRLENFAFKSVTFKSFVLKVEHFKVYIQNFYTWTFYIWLRFGSADFSEAHTSKTHAILLKKFYFQVDLLFRCSDFQSTKWSLLRVDLLVMMSWFSSWVGQKPKTGES